MLNRIIYPIITLCLAGLFAFSIDIFDFYQWNTLFTIVGGLCTTAALALSLSAWLLKDRELTNAQEKQFKIVVWVASIVFLLGFGYFLSHDSKEKVMAALNEDGVYATGTLLTGRSDHSLKTDDKFILVNFYDGNRKKQEAQIYVNDSVFSTFLKGQKIPLIYHSEHPELVKMLLTNEDLSRYSGFKNRPLTLTDMMKMVDLKPGKQIQNYLNGVNLQWRILPGYYEDNYRYFNELKLLLVASQDGIIRYMHNEFNPALFNSELKKYGFKQAVVMGEKVYVNDKYVVAIRSEEIPLVPKDYDEIDYSDAHSGENMRKVSAFAVTHKSTLGVK